MSVLLNVMRDFCMMRHMRLLRGNVMLWYRPGGCLLRLRYSRRNDQNDGKGGKAARKNIHRKILIG